VAVSQEQATDNANILCGNSNDKSVIKKAANLRNLAIVVVTAVSLIGLYFISEYSYLLFHNIVEVFSIVIALVIFVIAWKTRRIIGSNYFLFIGIAFVFVDILDLFLAGYNKRGVP